MIKFLLDANLSPETAEFLRNLNFDVKSLLEEGLGQIFDEEVIKLALKEERIIITHDLDFGEIYHFKEEKRVGLLVLKLKDQTIESVNRILGKFLEEKIIQRKKLRKSLVILDESTFRIYRG